MAVHPDPDHLPLVVYPNPPRNIQCDSSRSLAVVKPAVLVVMAVLDVAGVVPRGLAQVGTEDGEIHKSVTLLQSGSGSSRGQNRSKLKNLSCLRQNFYMETNFAAAP